MRFKTSDTTRSLAVAGIRNTDVSSHAPSHASTSQAPWYIQYSSDVPSLSYNMPDILQHAIRASDVSRTHLLGGVGRVVRGLYDG